MILLALAFPGQALANDTLPVPEGSPKANLTRNMIVRVEAAIRTKLIDPGSAKFSDIKAFRIKDDHIFVCGMINSKNKFGGYTGPSPFSFEFVPSPSSKDGYEGTLPAVWSTEISADFFYSSFAPACLANPKF